MTSETKMFLLGLKQLTGVLVLLLLGLTRHRAEGFCSVEHCTNDTRCLLAKDQRSCKCVIGYYDEKCDKDADFRVTCEKDYITFRALEDFFKYHKVLLESLHLPNKSCRAQRVVIDHKAYYMSKISKENYSACGGKPLTKNLTHIMYSLSLLSEPQVTGNIIRDPIIKLHYSCTYTYTRTVSLAFPIIPLSSDVVMRVDDIDATVQLLLYTDSSYTKAYSSSPTIELRDKVYVELTVTEPADFFLLLVRECWATQFPQPNTTEGLLHNLLQNGCVKDHTVSFLNVSETQPSRNGGNSTIRYSFDMFRFTTEPHELYLHCTVQLCEPIDHQSCTPNCNSISKREAVRADPNRGLLSYGPIKIDMPDRTPSDVLMTVVLPVAGVWTACFFLIIVIAVAKAGNRRLKQRENK